MNFCMVWKVTIGSLIPSTSFPVESTENRFQRIQIFVVLRIARHGSQIVVQDTGSF